MISDADIIRQATTGSQDSASQLFERCWPALWAAAAVICRNRADAEDAAQEAMLRVYRSLERFDRSKPLDPWLHRIAANCALDVLRSRSQRASEVQVEPASVDETAYEPNAHSGVAEAVDRLQPDRRLVIVLRYWLGFRINEIADYLEIPEGTVMSRIGRALDDLRPILEGELR